MKKVHLFLLVFCISVLNLYAQQKNATAVKYAETIKADDLKKHLYILAADSMEGRYTGKEGQKKAARYIENHFKNIGLSAPVKINNQMQYQQPYHLSNRSWGEVYIKGKNITLNFQQNLFVIGDQNQNTAKEYELLYAGFGIDTTYYSDYKNIDPTGKALICFAGEPSGKTAWAKHEYKWKYAKQKGATALIIIGGNNDAEFADLMKYYAFYTKKETYNELVNPNSGKENIYFVSMAAAAQLLGISEAELLAQKNTIKNTNTSNVDAQKKHHPITLKSERIEKISTSAENVLGFLEGTDKKEEVLVITAHYDHIGKNSAGEVFNGADDDASGTSCVLEIAEAFMQAAKEGYRPRRSILFMTVSGEELGLYGSEYYTDINPIFPLENTVANLNIDMVGRLGGDYETSNNPNYIYLIGSDKLSTDLHNISETANSTYTQLKLDYKYNSDSDPNRFYNRSDHYNFAEKKIPIIFYFNGTHVDYHGANDTADKIHYPKMEKIAHLVFHTAWEIANRDQRPVVNK
ncbi:MAG: M28 family peptidase [Cytophagales bacterium]|nr:MAG: M28 family peptidase [Cytophagales bacterium]